MHFKRGVNRRYIMFGRKRKKRKQLVKNKNNH